MIRKCNDLYGYGCDNQIEVEAEDGFGAMFYKKGSVYMGVCKKCVLKKHAEKWKSGDYNYRKKGNKIIDSADYGTVELPKET